MFFSPLVYGFFIFEREWFLLNFKKIFNDKYFIVNINDLKCAIKEEKIQIKNIDITKFEELPEEYKKLIIVIPAFPVGKGWLYEFVSNYSFDVHKLKQEKNEKTIECIGYDKISFYFNTLFVPISENEVYNFFNKLNSNEELMNKYIKAINSVFYKNQIDKEILKNNKNLIKIRRKYE